MESKYLNFEQSYSEGKTKRFLVKNKSGERLGCIKWWSHWRRYVFISLATELIFDTSCLGDIKKFIDELMLEWKVEVQNKKSMS